MCLNFLENEEKEQANPQIGRQIEIIKKIRA
jgi:hypothetical protein